MRLRPWTIGCLLVSLVCIGACSSGAEKRVVLTLNAPAGSSPQAFMAVNQGNLAFATGRWAEAKTQYERALQAQPKLAEAHYNLALTLDRLGDRDAADEHYTQAANFAPGHAVIWNSRKYRRYGDVTVQQKTGGPIPGAPGLGGLGGIGGGAGGIGGAPAGTPPGGF